MKLVPWFFPLVALAALACGDDSSTKKPANSGGFPSGVGGYAPGSGGGGGTSPGTGGTTGPTDAGSACSPMSFSQAPLPCSQDISHAKLEYPLPCDDPAAKGYIAKCGTYDAVIAPDGSGKAYCFYAKQTGNLVGAISTKSGRVCMSFDLDFDAPDTASCAPTVAGNCPP